MVLTKHLLEGDFENVDVIIPCFNAEQTIERAILSALHQVKFAGRVVIVDDGSSDTSIVIMRRMRALYPNRILLLEQQNMGACHARKTGALQSRAKYLAFLDADDYWHPRKLCLQIDLMESHPHIVATTTWFRSHLRGDRFVSRIRKFAWGERDIRSWVMLGTRAPALNSSLIVRREHYLSIGGHDESLGSYADDLDLGFRLWKTGGVACVPADLVRLGFSPNQVHRHQANMMAALREVLGRISAADSKVAAGAIEYLEGNQLIRGAVSSFSMKTLLILFGWFCEHPRFLPMVLRYRSVGLFSSMIMGRTRSSWRVK